MSFPAPQIPFKCGIRGRMGDLNGLLLLFPRLPFSSSSSSFSCIYAGGGGGKGGGEGEEGRSYDEFRGGGRNHSSISRFFLAFIRVRHALTEEEGRTFFVPPPRD